MSRKWIVRVSVAALVAVGLVGTAAVAGAAANSDHIWAGEKLVAGAYQTSNNGQYRLIQQSDGNLVEYKRVNGNYTEAIWSTGTARNPGAATFVQRDGNLVVRKNTSPTSTAIWSSNTATPNVSHLTVQNDGNVVLYDRSGTALWASRGLSKPAPKVGDDYPARWKNAAQDTVVDDWQMYNRECTSFVAWRVQSRNGFNVRSKGFWDASAGKWGAYFGSNKTPRPGAVAESGGHVAWVAAVDGGRVLLEDYNRNYDGRYDRYWATASHYRYIHLNN